MKLEKRDIVLELKDSAEVTDELQDDLFKLAFEYDLYTGAIDDGAQYKAANDRNDNILEELFENGVSKIIFKDHTPMMSSSVYDYEIDLTKEYK